MSLNLFIVLALAEKVSALKTAEFFAERIARAQPDRLERIVAKATGHAPLPGDELPDGWRSAGKNRKRSSRERKAAA